MAAVWTTAACAAPDKVLFVGNSFSFYNNGINNHFENLVHSAGRPMRARLIAISGGRLFEHVPTLPGIAASEDWDVIVLQDHSRGPIDDQTAQSFRESARNLAHIARDNNAEPAFFMTWPYIDQPEMLALLDDAYSSIGAELNAPVVPVGVAFANASSEKPELALRMADGKHPTLAGTYLAVCVFYAALNAVSPEGLDYTGGLDAADAAFLQHIAWEAVSKRKDQSEAP